MDSVGAEPAGHDGPDASTEPRRADANEKEPRAEGQRGRTGILFGVAAVVLLLDQFAKTWAVRTLSTRGPIQVVGSLQLGLHKNTGGSFSVAGSLGPLIGVLAFVVVIVLAITGRSTRSTLTAIMIGLLIGGALGNLADRLFRAGLDGRRGLLHGAVVDFIDLQWWPVFNVADTAIVVGGVSLALTAWFGPGDHGNDPGGGEPAK